MDIITPTDANLSQSFLPLVDSPKISTDTKVQSRTIRYFEYLMKHSIQLYQLNYEKDT